MTISPVLQPDFYPSGINNYVPNMRYASDVDHLGVAAFHFGSPSVADTDGVHADLDADGALTTITTMVPGTGGDGATADANFGRNIDALPSADPGATGYTCVVHGRDYLGQPMAETLTIANAQTTATVGKKAFATIEKIVPTVAATDAITVDIGWGSRFGAPYKLLDVVGGLEDGVPVSFKEQVLSSGNVTVSGANAGTILAPFDGFIIGTSALITTAVTVGPAVMDAVVGGSGAAAFDITIGIGVKGVLHRSAGSWEDRVAVSEGDAVVLTSDAGATAGVAEIYAMFAQARPGMVKPVDTDPQTLTLGDPRGLIVPAVTLDGTVEIEYRLQCDFTANSSGNGGLHGIAHVNA